MGLTLLPVPTMTFLNRYSNEPHWGNCLWALRLGLNHALVLSYSGLLKF